MYALGNEHFLPSISCLNMSPFQTVGLLERWSTVVIIVIIYCTRHFSTIMLFLTFCIEFKNKTEGELTSHCFVLNILKLPKFFIHGIENH